MFNMHVWGGEGGLWKASGLFNAFIVSLGTIVETNLGP